MNTESSSKCSSEMHFLIALKCCSTSQANSSESFIQDASFVPFFPQYPTMLLQLLQRCVLTCVGIYEDLIK